MADWLTVSEAAKELGVSSGRVRSLISRGELVGGIKRTGSWFLPRSVLTEFKRKPVGRPKKTI